MSDINLNFTVPNNSINFTVQPNDITITQTPIELAFYPPTSQLTATSLNASINNVHITGGTNGYVLQTDGTGNLTWTAQTGNGGGGNGTPGGSNTQIQFNDSGSFGGNVGFTFNKITGNLNVPGNIIGNVSNANYANFAGSALTADTAIYATNAGNANIANVANAVAGANVTGIVANANFASYSNNANFSTYTTTANGLNADISNVHISGGSNGYVLQTNGSGNLNWVNIIPSKIANGNSNVNIPVANSNIVMTVNGFTGATIAGEGVYAPTLHSTVATGVPPIVVNSTTLVPNLYVGSSVNAGSANTAQTVIANAQPNITSVGVLSNLTIGGADGLTVTNTINGGAANIASLTVNNQQTTANRFSANLVTTNGSTYANLPISAYLGIGSRAVITNANTTTFNSLVSGGGSNIVPVFYDGTNWRVG